MLGVVFFLQKNFDFFKTELKFQKIIYLWSFLLSYEGLKIAIRADLAQLTRDIFRAINALAEI